MTSIYDSVNRLKGVGPKRQEALSDLGIETIFDLLTFFPFRYEDLTVRDITEIEDKEKVVLQGTSVSSPVVNYYGRKKSRLQFRINVDHVIIPVTFFNQPYLNQYVHANEEITVFGVWDLKRQALTGIKILKTDATTNQEAVYRSNKDIKQQTIFKLIKQAWDDYADFIPEILPKQLVDKYQLISFKEAIRQIHFPQKNENTEIARNTLVFTEFFIYQLKLQFLRRRNKQQQHSGQLNTYDIDQLKIFLNDLPFELTNAQKRAVNEICKDLLQPRQMFRLLQGDVGSGKTVVAASAIYAVFTSGRQSAIMAPTEILADQHMASFEDLFNDFDLSVALLTSSTPKKERDQILEHLKDGTLDCIIGTHALIQSDVHFNDLGLVIIDEQHRFGVNQRRMLREKADHPDVLFMTATPIPRTLSITTYGEMDVSMINELPAGRNPVKTIWIKPKQSDQLKEFILKELTGKSQVYVVSPLIEESEHLDVQNATELFYIYRHMFPNYNVGLLHGKMKPTEKEEIMSEFNNNNIQILVSTTVIEVGVNVKNATVMIIHDADRFGLAQLHQLRGRVGRGSKQAYCILIAEPKSETGQMRMQMMTEISDGFLLSEKDLQMRGPGDVLGKLQSGMPQFKIGNIVEEAPILEKARQESILYLSEHNLEDMHKALLKYLKDDKAQLDGILD